MRKRIIKCAIALLLVLSMLGQHAGTVLATERLDNMYVSEISVGTKEALEADGFTVTDENLNEGGTDVYIGYKLTDDPDEAITDVSVLGMYGHYSQMTYQEILLNDSESVIEMGTMLQTAVSAFAEKYNSGSEFASLAYDILNARTIPNDLGDEVPLGEYLISSSRTLDDFKKIGLISSNIGISYILNQLCIGTADNSLSGESTWIQRLCDNGPLEFVDEDTGETLDEGTIEAIYTEQYDSQYMQRAKRLYAAVSAFTDDYLEAQDRSGSIEDIDVSDADATEAAENVTEAFSEGTTLEFDTDVDISGEEAGDMLPLALYALLDERDDEGKPIYPFGTKSDGTVSTARTLAEFFIEVGSMEEGDDAYRALYPLIVSKDGVTPLSDGQEVLMYLSGLSNMISTGVSSSDSLEEARKQSEEQVAELLALNNGEKLPIWFDVNTEIYDECQDGVYWTSELAREAAAGDRYDLLTKPSGAKDLTLNQKLKNAAIYVGCVGAAAMGAAAISSALLVHFGVIKGITGLVSAFITYATSQTVAYTTGAVVGLALGTVFIAVVAVAVVALLVIGIIWLFKNIFSDDDEPELEMEEMPKVMYDYNDEGEGSAVIYYSVNTVGTTTPANLNEGNKNTPWITMYYSKDPSLGEPITAETDGQSITTEPFVVTKGSQNTPDGYSPVGYFESITAANLNDYRSGGVTGVYAYFHRLGAVSEVDEEQGEYISSLKLFSAEGDNAEETAKSQAIIEGYSLIDFNLTSDSNIASYVGYKSTDNASDAITDIRVTYAVGYNPNNASITYGGAQYGCYGNIGNLLLMETKNSSAGTPILTSEIVVTDTLGDAPEGYEPVNLFCGGPAFDFNNCNTWQFSEDDFKESDFKEASYCWESHAFIYFHPSTTYTSGTEYLGGLAFFSGEATDYMTEMGWKPLTNENLSGGSDENITYDLGGVQDGTTTLCYSTTYNPYRAIYDIQYFGAEASTQILQANVSLSSGGSVPCEVFQQSGGSVGNNRMIRISHAYRSSIWYEGGGKYSYADYVDQVSNWDISKKDVPYVEWYNVNGSNVASNICCAGLYVVGRTVTEANSSPEPIEISELLVSASPEYDEKTWTPVRSMADSYSETGANLAFNDIYNTGNMYLYIKRADANAKIPTYIASINVAYVKGHDMDDKNGVVNPYDTAVFELVGKGAGQLLEVDLTGAQNWQERVSTYYHEIASASTRTFGSYQDVEVMSHDSDYAAALVWVTYTNKKTEGISDIVIYESADGTVPDIVKTADGATTDSCGDGFQLNGKGTYYFLRAVYSAGNPITDLVIDKEIMTEDYWTSISTTGKASSYELFYIKSKHFRKATLTYYISGIYSASGSSEKEALYNLLSQGCRYYCPFNLSPDNGKPLYVGYSLSTSYKVAYSGLILHDSGQDDTVNTIVKGRDTYNRVTDSLNSGVYDSIISMYLTKSVRKACETGGTMASNGHYITGITFFNSKDLNDYATGDKSLDDLDARTRAYVEKYIVDDDGDPMYWDVVTDSNGKIINCNITALSGGVLDTSAPEVYMYIHYSDNETPYWDSLTGSIFTNNPVMAIVICFSGTLVLLAVIYLVLKKRKTANDYSSASAE